MRLKSGIFLLLVSLEAMVIASPSYAVAPQSKTGGPAFHNENGVVELESCKQEGVGARCTVWVTVNEKSQWWFSKSNALHDENGAPIPATEVTIAGTTQNIEALQVIGAGVNIEPGVRTRIIYDFQGPLDFKNISGLTITMGRWNNTYTFPYIPK